MEIWAVYKGIISSQCLDLFYLHFGKSVWNIEWGNKMYEPKTDMCFQNISD